MRLGGYRSRDLVSNKSNVATGLFRHWVRNFGQNMQEVGLGQLASWLRETARSGGLLSAPFCFGLQDAAAKDWQSAAVEKRYVQPAGYQSFITHCALISNQACVYIFLASFRQSWHVNSRFSSLLKHLEAPITVTCQPHDDVTKVLPSCRYRACLARMRQVTHDSPSEVLDDTGQSRRSTRVRNHPDVFVPSYSSEELTYR